MVGAYCALFVVSRLLFVVRCSLCAVCCVVPVAYPLFVVVWCVVVCCLFGAGNVLLVRCALLVGCRLLFVGWLFGDCCLLSVVRYLFAVRCADRCLLLVVCVVCM